MKRILNKKIILKISKVKNEFFIYIILKISFIYKKKIE